MPPMSTNANLNSPVQYQALARDAESKYEQQSCWRPTPLRRIALVATVLISLMLLCLVILSHYHEYKIGAVLVAKSAHGLSDSQIFLFKYLPTILIVLFGMWISVIDLDVKRLEPFYQLSYKAQSKHSPLLCGYDTDFFLKVLLTSLHRRDLVVFTSSVLLIFTTMIIPAVQNSMLLSRIQTQETNVQASQIASLVDPTTQTTRMSYNFLTTAYSVCWLGQDNPAYTTRDSSFAPFTHSLTPEDTIETSLKVPTTRYWTELSCSKPASTYLTTNSSHTFAKAGFTVSFDDGRGCNTTDLLRVDASVSWTYDADYEAYYFAAPSVGYASPGPSLGQACPQSRHMFLAVYRVRGLDYLRPPNFGERGNATAMFCEPQYYSEPVIAKVATSNYSLLSYQATGSKQQISDDVFNRTHFEYLLALGVPPPTANQAEIDMFDQSGVLQTTRLKNASVSAPTPYSSDNMIGYLLGTSQFNSSQYLDYNTLQTGYNQAYQLLFALAMSHNYNNVPNLTQTAVLGSVREVVALVREFAIATEVLFVLAILACIYLLVTVPRRTLRLIRDPDSLAEIMILIRDATTRKAFAGLSTSTNKDLDSNLNSEAFELQIGSNGLPILNHPLEHTPSSRNRDTDKEASAFAVENHPLEMSWFLSVIILLTITASIVIFVILHEGSLRTNGLASPSGTDLVNQLLLNFLPTTFATILGAYLSLLCRTASFLKPLESLKKGNARASHTLLAKYNSLPAPLVFLKALNIGHVLLAALSIATVLSNVLTVSFAGIFIRKDVISNTSTMLHSVYHPLALVYQSNDDVTPSTRQDSIYAMVANATGATKLPTWTTYEWGYIPVAEDSIKANVSAVRYDYESLGFGAELQCVDLLATARNTSSLLQFRNQGTEFFLSTNFTTFAGQTCQCSLNYANSITGANSHMGDGFGPVSGSAPESLSSFEIVQNYKTGVSRQNGDITYQLENQCDFCDQWTVFGWVRGRLVPTQVGLSNLTATGKFEYNTTIIGYGHILAAKQLGSPNYEIDPSINLTATYNTSVNTISAGGASTWHTDVLSRDYANYLYKKINGTDLLDSLLPPPSFETASTIVSNVFARVFATQLFIDRRNLQAVSPTSNVELPSGRVGLLFSKPWYRPAGYGVVLNYNPTQH